MPTPTIPAGNLYMNATLFTGTGATQTITNGAAGASFQPDLVWSKTRSTSQSNSLIDSVRGITKVIYSDYTGAEDTFASMITSLNSNGVTYGSGNGVVNSSPYTYVAWQWKAGGTAVTNTSGTISSQVSANTTSGFSIVTYTGNGSSTATVGHGLGVEPAMLVQFERSGGDWWHVWNSGLSGSSYNLFLNNTNAERASINDGQIKNNGSSTFAFASTTSNVDAVNQNGAPYVVYCWSQIAGYSAFGKYTGNGSTDGPFIYTGFRPRFLLVKRTDSGGDWNIVDTSRNTSNVANLELFPNDARSETTGGGLVADLNSNGFKIRTSDSFYNASGSTQIYAAFAENPFKYANAR